MKYNWHALLGNFIESESNMLFKGGLQKSDEQKVDAQPGIEMGMFICDQNRRLGFGLM